MHVSRLVKTSIVCARFLIEVDGRKYRVNLICLPLEGLDVILGMDWLSTNHILAQKMKIFCCLRSRWLGKSRKDLNVSSF